MAIAGIVLWTSVSGPCDQDLATVSQNSCNTCYLNDTFNIIQKGGQFDGHPIGSTSISLTTTFYAPNGHTTIYPTDVLSRFEAYDPEAALPLSSFIKFISSQTQLLMSLPILASCSYV